MELHWNQIMDTKLMEFGLYLVGSFFGLPDPKCWNSWLPDRFRDPIRQVPSRFVGLFTGPVSDWFENGPKKADNRETHSFGFRSGKPKPKISVKPTTFDFSGKFWSLTCRVTVPSLPVIICIRFLSIFNFLTLIFEIFPWMNRQLNSWSSIGRVSPKELSSSSKDLAAELIAAVLIRICAPELDNNPSMPETRSSDNKMEAKKEAFQNMVNGITNGKRE